VTYYSDLVDLLDEFGRTQDVGRACEKLGAALFRLGRYDAALPILERTEEMYRGLRDLEGRRRTLAQIGWLHAVRGTPDEGISRIESVLETLDPDTPSPGLTALYVAVGQMHMVRGRYSEAASVVERALEIARAAGDIAGLSASGATLSDLLPLLARFDEALQVAEDASHLAEQSGDLPALCTVYRAMIGGHLYKGEFARARVAGDRAVEVAEQLGDPEVITLTLSSRASVTRVTGEWDLARVDVERAVALGREIGRSDATGFALLQYGHYCLCTGEWEKAARHLEECVAMAARSHQIPLAQRLLAEIDLLLGRPEQARERLAPFLDRPGLTDRETLWLAWVRPVLARVHLELGEPARATDILLPYMARCRQTGNRYGLVEGLHAQAMVAAQLGHWGEAKDALEEGLLLAQSLPAPRDEARLLQVYGRMHASKGEPERARERLEQALAIFGRLGAKKDAERTDQELNQLD
jgi:tetratricopeptide (TPR) repeat protein